MSPPFGIEKRHIDLQRRGYARRYLQLVLIGAPLILALFGVLGTGDADVTEATTSAVHMRVETPTVLRSGNWFETDITVAARSDVADLRIAVDRALWRQLSVDTMVPDAQKTEAIDGRFVFSFGPVKAGERFQLKIDGQIQPHWLRRLNGRIAVTDGDQPLASVPMSILVLP
jgi:hypothetical protein